MLDQILFTIFPAPKGSLATEGPRDLMGHAVAHPASAAGCKADRKYPLDSGCSEALGVPNAVVLGPHT